jgi:acetyl esterase/lipase
MSSLAYLRDGTLDSSSAAAAAAPTVPLPAGALLISPAVDFTISSVFGTKLAAYFEALQYSQQQQGQHQGVNLSALPAVPQPPGAEWDYITAREGPSIAQGYVKAQSDQDMHHPLVSPTLLPSFKGLVPQKMLVLWGEIEVLAPDCARFAERVQADGVPVQVHVEPNQVHVYCVLPVADAVERGAQVVVPFLASCVRNA